MATKMINVLLMALTALVLISNTSATSISESDHDVLTSNYSISTFNGSEANPAVDFLVPIHQKSFSPCPYDKNIDFADGCYCWGGSPDKYAIDRHWMIEAITQACDNMAGGEGDPVREYGLNLPGISNCMLNDHQLTHLRHC